MIYTILAVICLTFSSCAKQPPRAYQAEYPIPEAAIEQALPAQAAPAAAAMPAVKAREHVRAEEPADQDNLKMEICCPGIVELSTGPLRESAAYRKTGILTFFFVFILAMTVLAALFRRRP